MDPFDPDYVIITDAWNMKPILAEAVRGYPYFLRFQAQECLCPLNNLRLLASGPEQLEQCPRNHSRRPCSVAAAWPSAASIRERSISGNAPWPGSARRNTTESFAGLWKRPRPCCVLNPLTGDTAGAPRPPRCALYRGAWTRPRFPGRRPTLRGTVGTDAPVKTLFMAAVAGEFIKGVPHRP